MFDWIAQKVNDSIFGTISKILSDLLTWAFKLMSELILNLNNLNAYFDYSTYLLYAQIIAGSLLAVAVVFEVLKSMSGNIIPGSEEHSMSTYVGRVTLAGLLIYFLPWSVQNIFMEINNALIGVINSIPIKYTFDSTDVLMGLLSGGFGGMSWSFLLISFVIVIGFLIVGIMGGIRYIELIISILLAPFVAISIVRKGEALSVWVRETTSITFTQALHVMLLKILATIIGTVSNPIILPLLVIGVLVVMIRGPQVLRKFLYSTGTGSASVGAVGGAGRMAAMKFMLSK